MGKGWRRDTIDRADPTPYHRDTNSILAAGAVHVIDQILSETSP
jgi:hypothetical protein